MHIHGPLEVVSLISVIDRSKAASGSRRSYLLMVMGTPTPETSVTVIWNAWYSRRNAWRSQGVSATA